MEELCPDALLMNYSNPMAMICWAINDYSKIKAVGLCPNAPSAAKRLADMLGADMKDVFYWAAGINHFSFYLEFKVKGKDAYPLLREKFKDPKVYLKPNYLGKGIEVDRVEVEMLHNFGYFTSGSQAHLSMYTPYFRKRPELSENTIWMITARFSAARPRPRSTRIKNYANNSPADLNLRLPTSTAGANMPPILSRPCRRNPAPRGRQRQE